MSKIRTLAGQTAIYGASNIIARFLNFLLVPLYTYSNLSRGEYGTNTEMYALIAFVYVILTYGMETAYFRYIEIVDDRKKVYSTALISLMSTSVIFIFFTNIFSQPIATWMHYPTHPEYIIWFGWIVTFDAITAIPFTRLRAENKANRFAFIKVMNIAICIALNVFFIVICPFMLKHGIFTNFVNAVFSGKVEVKYIFISNLIASGFTTLLLLKELFDFRSGFDFNLWKKMMIYALPLLLFGFAGVINETLDRVLIKYLLPENIALDQLGIYGACYKISIFMTLFIQAYKYAAEPFFFAQAKESDAKQTYVDLMNYFIIIVSFIFLITTMYLNDVFIYFIGRPYRVGAAVIPILLLANLCLGIYYNLSIWYKLTNKTIYGAYLSVFGAVVTLVLNFLWIPVYRYMGSAWATLICYFSMMVLSYFVGQKHFPINYNIKKALGYLGVAVIFYFITYFLKLQIMYVRLSVHTIFVILFILMVIKIERPKFFKLKVKS